MKPGVLCGASALSLLCAACTGGSADPGLDLDLRIPGAQLVREPFPGGTDDGPRVTLVDAHLPEVYPGEAAKLIEGRVTGDTYALAVGLANDRGYWLVQAGVPDPTVESELTFTTRADLSLDVPPGDRTLLLRALGDGGNGGPSSETPLTVLDPAPDGELVVALWWDSSADIDLHVTDGNGVTLNPKNIASNERDPTLPPPPPDAELVGGYIDADSNFNCTNDGRRRENAIWATLPPTGTYRVAVDLASACGTVAAPYRIEVRRRGDTVTRAAGILYPSDARESAQGGAVPLSVTEFDVAP